MSDLCCICGKPSRGIGQRYCLAHHAEAQKRYRQVKQEQEQKKHHDRGNKILTGHHHGSQFLTQ